MKFIHLTDTHLIADAGDLYGTNPKQRLQQAVAHILAHQPDAQAVTITGDLTHYGHTGAYEHLRECLAPLTMPVFPILGNHDHRQIFQKYFPHVGRDPEGFVQYAVDFGDHLAVFLDTNEPGVHWGVFCERRAAWLREQLEGTAKPVLLFMHHPFFPIGIRSMDFLSLRDTGPFMAAIAGFEARIQQVFSATSTARSAVSFEASATRRCVALTIRSRSICTATRARSSVYMSSRNTAWCFWRPIKC